MNKFKTKFTILCVLVTIMLSALPATTQAASEMPQPRFEICDGGNYHMSNWYYDKDYIYYTDDIVYIYSTRTCSYCGYNEIYKLKASFPRN